MKDSLTDLFFGILGIWLLTYFLFHQTETSAFLDAILAWRP